MSSLEETIITKIGLEVDNLNKKISAKVDQTKFNQYVGENGEILGIGQNLFFKKDENISMEAFVLKKELLIKLICDGIQDGAYYTVKDLISRNIARLSINGYEFKGYLACINSTKEYFDFNMDLLNKETREDIFNKDGRKVYTKTKDTPPSMFKEKAEIVNSVIANGCILGGKVKNSILARGATVEDGAVLKNIIVDKNNVIKCNERLSASRNYPLVIEKSIKWDKEHYRDLLEYLKGKGRD